MLFYVFCAFAVRGQMTRNQSDHSHPQTASACFDKKVTYLMFSSHICSFLACFYLKKKIHNIHCLQHFGQWKKKPVSCPTMVHVCQIAWNLGVKEMKLLGGPAKDCYEHFWVKAPSLWLAAEVAAVCSPKLHNPLKTITGTWSEKLLKQKHVAAAGLGLCHIRASSPCAHVGMRPIRTAANLESLEQSENSFLLMESFLPKERHCFQTQPTAFTVIQVFFLYISFFLTVIGTFTQMLGVMAHPRSPRTTKSNK